MLASSVWLNENAPVPVWDTCLAVLFLKRATRPLVDVASEDEAHKKKP